MKKVLVVDDEKTMLTSLSISLEERGFEVDTSKTGHEALAKIKDKEYDHLITDVKMSGISGYELADSTSCISPKTKIILISAYGFPIGFNKYPHLTKPFRFSDLLETLEKFSHED